MPQTLGALVESGQSCGLTTAWQSWVLVENMSAWHNQRFATQGNGMAEARRSGARLAFNTRLMVRWISMLSSWHKAGYFTYSGRRDEAEARFASGECAMLTSSSAAYARAAQARRLRPRRGAASLLRRFRRRAAEHAGRRLGAVGARRQARRPVPRRGELLRLPRRGPRCRPSGTSAPATLPLTAAAYELTRKQGFYRSHPEQEIAVRQLLARPTEDSGGIRLGGLRHIRGIIDEELESVWNGKKTPLDALNAAVQRGNLLLDGTR